MRNAYLEVNKRRIQNLLYRCEEHVFKGSNNYGNNLSLKEVMSLIRTLINELKITQSKLNNSEKENEELKKMIIEINTIKEKSVNEK